MPLLQVERCRPSQNPGGRPARTGMAGSRGSGSRNARRASILARLVWRPGWVRPWRNTRQPAPRSAVGSRPRTSPMPCSGCVLLSRGGRKLRRHRSNASSSWAPLPARTGVRAEWWSPSWYSPPAGYAAGAALCRCARLPVPATGTPLSGLYLPTGWWATLRRWQTCEAVTSPRRRALSLDQG